MLIDTKQVVSLTDLRIKLPQIIDAVEEGNTFILTEKGKIKAKIVSAEENRSDIFAEIEEIRARIDKRLSKKRKVWNSVKLIRKMREDRTKHLLKLAGIPYKK